MRRKAKRLYPGGDTYSSNNNYYINLLHDEKEIKMRAFVMLSGKPGSEIISELESRGATIHYNFSLIDAIGIEIDDINKVKDLDFVSDVRESGKLKILLEDAITEIGALDVLNQGVYGEGIAIAVLDSGIISTPQLTYSLIAERDFTGEGVFDGVGHGTIVSKIIKATAPESLLINAKVCNSDMNFYKRSFFEILSAGFHSLT